MDDPDVLDSEGVPPASSPVREEEDFDFSSRGSDMSSSDEHGMDATNHWPTVTPWHTGLSSPSVGLPSRFNQDTQPSVPTPSIPVNVRSALYELLATPPLEEGSSRMQIEMETRLGMWSGRWKGQSPIQLNIATTDFDATFANLESQQTGKGKGKAVDFLETPSVDDFGFYDGENDMDTWEDYSSHEEDDDFTPLSDLDLNHDCEMVGDYSPNQHSLDIGDHWFNFLHQAITKPSYENESFVAGPSRITLDDLRRSSMKSRLWQ